MISASLATAGRLLVLECPAPPAVTAATAATVTINGAVVTVPFALMMVCHNDLTIQLPPGSVQTNNSATITISVPGVTTGAIPVVNNAGVDRLPTAPPANAAALVIGMNDFTPTEYVPARLSADLVKQLGAWSSPLTVLDSNGLPVGGPVTFATTGYVPGANPHRTPGTYLLRYTGAGRAWLLTMSSTNPLVAAPVVASAVGADGWNWIQCNDDPTCSPGWRVCVQPPVSGLELWVPGAFDPKAGIPTTYYDPAWTAAYGAFDLRNMNGLRANNCNLARVQDVKGPMYLTDSANALVTTAAIKSIVPSASPFLAPLLASGWASYLVTHDAPGDPFRTGQVTTLSYRPIERVSPTQFRFITNAPPAAGATFTMTVSQGYAWESVSRIANHYGKSCWVNVPPLLEPAGVEQMARRLAATLACGQKLRLEYGNENWNSGNGTAWQWAYCLCVGMQVAKDINYALGTLPAQCHAIFRQVFAAEGRSADLECVLAYQAGATAQGAATALKYYLAASGGVYPDVFAVAPYFAQQISAAMPPAFAAGLTAADILDITEQALRSPTGNARYTNQWAGFVANTPMRLVTYENNIAWTPGTTVPGFYDACLAALSDPRMKGIHWLNLSNLIAAGFKENYHFCSVATIINPASMWPAQYYMGQTDSQVLQALQAWVAVPVPVPTPVAG